MVGQRKDEPPKAQAPAPAQHKRQPRPEQTQALREAALRDAALQAAVRAALNRSASDTRASSYEIDQTRRRDRERRRWMSQQQKADQLEFVQAIATTASLLSQARDANGEPIYPTDARYKLLAALERIGGWPSISELARALRCSKQAAREQVIGAAREDLLELLPDPHDGRSIQVGLTPSGKHLLSSARARQFHLVARLLNGLETRDMRLVSHVLRVIRERLVAFRKLAG